MKKATLIITGILILIFIMGGCSSGPSSTPPVYSPLAEAPPADEMINKEFTIEHFKVTVIGVRATTQFYLGSNDSQIMYVFNLSFTNTSGADATFSLADVVSLSVSGKNAERTYNVDMYNFNKYTLPGGDTVNGEIAYLLNLPVTGPITLNIGGNAVDIPIIVKAAETPAASETAAATTETETAAVTPTATAQ